MEFYMKVKANINEQPKNRLEKYLFVDYLLRIIWKPKKLNQASHYRSW